MMDCTDRHDRYFLRLMSKNVMLYSEMVATKSAIHGDRKKILSFSPEEKPLALQVGGSNKEELSEVAKIAEDMGYDEININLGCPSKKVQKNKFGACLMKEPELVAECINSMVNSCKIPVTAKTRIGFDDVESFEYLNNFINKMHNAGTKTFILHARKAMLTGLSPKQNLNIPKLNYNMVYEIKKENPNLEIIINGGISKIEEIKNHISKCDGVMIGRAAYDNPFMLKDIEPRFYKLDSSINSKKEVLNLYLEYVERQIQNGHNLSRMMKHLFGLSRGDKHAKSFRVKILEVIRDNSLKNHKNELEDLLVY